MADNKIEWNGDAPEDKYDPSSVEVDRARQQGLGVGARDLARQRDPAPPAGRSVGNEDEEAGGAEPNDAA